MNDHLNAITAPPAIAIADMVRKMTAAGEKIAAMQTGEPFFPTPQYIKDGLDAALKQDHTHYSFSQGIPELRKALANYYKSLYSVTINPDEILLSCGAIGSIYTIYSAFFNEGDELIVVDPAWPQYANIATMKGVKVNHLSTASTNGRLTAALLEKAITKGTKLAVINNPCNPSGVVYSEDEINSFISTAKKHNVWLLFDEVYGELVFTDKFKSVLQCKEYEGYKQNIIYVNSFSKTFAMTGWRIGYAFLPPSLLSNALKVSQNSITNISTFSQYAAVVALTDKAKHEKEFTEMFNVYKERYSKLIDLLQKKKIEFLYPEGAFYFFIKCNKDSLEYAKDLLNNEKIAVVPGVAYGKDFSQYYRISYAVDDYSFNRYIEWLSK
jgi:aspartate/methionine/tyrosine aminotransferase